ncbi:hypothetical protein DUI87_08793 [Hirundo rustica rustica]|uniref:Uncharacterized protein n=1 Tax=Hirundo rustica rustica TaxID=333673 RepID=A0A3M0KQX8_HIRRU|nr:hypothetical protein DUI87_08793 [Hirundo rustica rustica]
MLCPVCNHCDISSSQESVGPCITLENGEQTCLLAENRPSQSHSVPSKITEQVFLKAFSRHIEMTGAGIRESQEACTRLKLRLTNPVALYNGETVLVDKGRAPDGICLAFCTASDMVPHNILADLEIHGLDGWTSQWMRN